MISKDQIAQLRATIPSDRIEHLYGRLHRIHNEPNALPLLSSESAHILALLRAAPALLDAAEEREGLREALKALTAKLQTISVRANSYGPDFPPTYADALWSLAREAERALGISEGGGA